MFHNVDREAPIRRATRKFELVVAFTTRLAYEVTASMVILTSPRACGGTAIVTYGTRPPSASSSESAAIGNPFTALLNIAGCLTWHTTRSYP